MGQWYKTDAPVSFRATTVIPNPLFPIIDQENYVKVERDYRRRETAAYPELYAGMPHDHAGQS